MKKFFLLTIIIASALAMNAQTGGLLVKHGEKGLYLDHVVAAKEGLYAIGRLYNVNPKFIAVYNKIDLNQGINIGQSLRIPLTDTNFTQKSSSGTPVYYEVGPNEGLLKVSIDNNKVPLKSLRDWNNLNSDNINAGSSLVIGFLVSKEMNAQRANEMVKTAEPVKQPVVQKPIEEKVVKAEPPKPIVEEKPVVKTEPTVADTKPELIEGPPAKTPPVAIKEEIKSLPAEGTGYFKSSFDQQVRKKPANKNSTVTSGIFKTTSGWQDAKYYLLIDGVTPGTIVRIVNPDNNKAVYAKVLGEMNGIRQNEGLDIRISNATASALQVTEDDKFVVKVNY